MPSITFLSTDTIIKINADQTRLYGGLHRVRDEALLDSAVHRPQVTAQGKYLFEDCFSMAATYAHGIIKNHPFIDGNKRTGMLAALLFLGINGYFPVISNDELVELGINIATNAVSLEEFAVLLRTKSIQ